MYQINYIYFLLTFNIRYTRDTKLTIYIWDRIVIDPPASHACFFCVFVCSDLDFCVCADKASVCSDANRVHCRIFPALAEYSAPGDFRVDVWFKLVGVFWRLVMFAIWFCIVLFCKLKNSLHGYDRDFQFCCLLSYQRCTLLLSSRHVTNTGRGKKKNSPRRCNLPKAP